MAAALLLYSYKIFGRGFVPSPSEGSRFPQSDPFARSNHATSARPPVPRAAPVAPAHAQPEPATLLLMLMLQARRDVVILVRVLVHGEVGAGEQRIHNALRELRLLLLLLRLLLRLLPKALLLLHRLRPLQIVGLRARVLRDVLLHLALRGLGAGLRRANVLVEVLVKLRGRGVHLGCDWGGAVHGVGGAACRRTGGAGHGRCSDDAPLCLRRKLRAGTRVHGQRRREQVAAAVSAVARVVEARVTLLTAVVVQVRPAPFLLQLERDKADAPARVVVDVGEDAEDLFLLAPVRQAFGGMGQAAQGYGCDPSG